MTDNILREFKKNVIAFLDELIDQFPGEPGLVVGRIFIKDRIDSEQLMHRFIQHVVPFKEQIESKDDEFFIKNATDIFGLGSSSQFNHFKKIWKSSQLDNEDRDVIWMWFQTFIMLCDKYSELRMKRQKN